MDLKEAISDSVIVEENTVYEWCIIDDGKIVMRGKRKEKRSLIDFGSSKVHIIKNNNKNSFETYCGTTISKNDDFILSNPKNKIYCKRCKEYEKGKKKEMFCKICGKSTGFYYKSQCGRKTCCEEHLNEWRSIISSGKNNNNYGNKWSKKQKKEASLRAKKWLKENKKEWLKKNRNRRAFGIRNKNSNNYCKYCGAEICRSAKVCNKCKSKEYKYDYIKHSEKTKRFIGKKSK